MTTIGIICFPGSTDAADTARAIRQAGCDPVHIAHTDTSFDADALIIPGGYSYGDYVRPGAIAATTPIAQAIINAANDDTPILGIGNGFQILCELGLLPGSLIENVNLKPIVSQAVVVIESADTTWTNAYQQGQQITLALKANHANYQASDAVLAQLEESNGVVARWVNDPTGSINSIAGVTNVRGNVVGIMAHPEYAIEALTGAGRDGEGFFTSIGRFVTMAKGESHE